MQTEDTHLVLSNWVTRRDDCRSVSEMQCYWVIACLLSSNSRHNAVIAEHFHVQFIAAESALSSTADVLGDQQRCIGPLHDPETVMLAPHPVGVPYPRDPSQIHLDPDQDFLVRPRSSIGDFAYSPTQS